jgi:hypothetical protein
VQLQAPRQSDRRAPILGGNVGDGVPTEAGEVGQSLLWEGGGSTTSLKAALPSGNRWGSRAHPTDRMLGDAGPNRTSAGTMGLAVATPRALARPSESREGLLLEFASRSIWLPWSPVDFFHCLSAARLSFSRGGRVGCRVHRGACAQVCFGVRRVDRFRTSCSRRDVERVQAEPVATPVMSPGDPFVPAGVLR